MAVEKLKPEQPIESEGFSYIGSSKPQMGVVRRIKGILPGIGLVCFGLIIGLIILEVGVRSLESISPPQRYRDYPSLWYMPESAVDNRDYFYTPEKPKDTFRIIVIGDSFTFGGKLQFYDNFVKRLERTLNLNDKQRKVEVMNWGVPGYATFQEAELMRRAIKNYNPDLVILEITLNDPELGPYKQTHRKSWLEQATERKPIFNDWRGLRFIATRIHNSLQNQNYMDHYHAIFNPDGDGWHRFTKSIDNIKSLGEEYHVPIVSVVFPLFSHTVNAQYPFAKYHDQIAQRLNQDGIPFLDLREAFENIPHERLEMVIGDDPHPNLIAHAIAADAIYQELESKKLIPEDVVVRYQTRRRELGSPYPADRPHTS